MKLTSLLLAATSLTTLALDKPALPSSHTNRTIDGWTVRVDDRLLQGEHAAEGAPALRLLESRLGAIPFVVPEPALTKLRAIPIQLDWGHGDLFPMQYHPGADWLRDNGYSEKLEKCVHIPNTPDFLEPRGIHQQPWVVLHELAHGYHDQVLGFEEPRLIAAWEKFRDSGKYTSIPHVNGKMHEHYALTDQMEFFAEMTEAYFGSNDFFPFVAGELRRAEPEIFALLSDIWGPLPGIKPEPAPAPKDEEIDTLRSKAAQGDAQAQVELAFRHRDGKGVPKDDREAMRWAHLAADQGNARALDLVGWMFFSGKGVRQDHRVAFGYYHAAAEGSAQGAYNLGQSFFAALGTEQDIPRALATWKSAAERGHGRAASTAAMVLLAGDGVSADPAEARRLAEKAAALNDPNGLVVLGEMQFQAGEIEAAKASWTKVSKMKPVGETGNPEQASDVMAAQQGADLLKLMDHRRRKPEPGKFARVHTPHLHQGWNNCGATSCAMYARALGKPTGSWEYKSFCPSPFGTGTDWSDLVAASARIGMKWKLVTFPPDDDGFAKASAFLRSELDAGRPVVVDFKYFGPQYPNGEAGHTLVVSGYMAEDDLFILCNPAIASPGLALITAADLKRYWRSNYYGAVSKGVMSRPAIVLDTFRTPTGFFP